MELYKLAAMILDEWEGVGDYAAMELVMKMPNGKKVRKNEKEEKERKEIRKRR